MQPNETEIQAARDAGEIAFRLSKLEGIVSLAPNLGPNKTDFTFVWAAHEGDSHVYCRYTIARADLVESKLTPLDWSIKIITHWLKEKHSETEIP